jgi:O-antigen biosynthesis protein
MSSLRETIKRGLPAPVRQSLIAARRAVAAPPLEDIVLHDYVLAPSAERRPRLSLVIPHVTPGKETGGLTTGLDIFLELGRLAGADLRVILDDFDAPPERRLVDTRARAIGLEDGRIKVLARTAQAPVVEVRSSDVFVSHNWWTTLNARELSRRQAAVFGQAALPNIYLIQDYEPQFYEFSSTHLMARSALGGDAPYWGVFNTKELYDYFTLQGHRAERAFVFEPALSGAMRPFLADGPTAKQRRILVYGRPSIPRNCFPALERGLRLWTEQDPGATSWEIVSAGLPHRPIALGGACELRSLGKLPIEDYAKLLRTTAVGLSLMASPHPSYPPLEMAHFGVLTITNTYANKDLSRKHDNIASIADVGAETISGALAAACARFEADPEAGWKGASHTPSFLAPAPFAFLADVAKALQEQAWRSARSG